MLIAVNEQSGGTFSGQIGVAGVVLAMTGTVSGSDFTSTATGGSYTVVVEGSVAGNTASGTWSDNDTTQRSGTFEVSR